MHVLFESSDDHPELDLLGLLPGSVGKLESWDVPVPHIGWNDISCVNPSVVASGGYLEDAPSVSILNNCNDSACRYNKTMHTFLSYSSISHIHIVSIPALKTYPLSQA